MMQECKHTNTEKRRLWFSNASRPHHYQVVDQCLDCGDRPNSNVYRHEKSDAFLNDFDQEARQALYSRQSEARRQEYEDARRQRNEEWWGRYNDYLNSSEWASRRVQALERDGHLCQARMSDCSTWATEVHHLDYRFLGDEPLFTLQSVCQSCHEKITQMSRIARGAA